jgi:hypothetical protein
MIKLHFKNKNRVSSIEYPESKIKICENLRNLWPKIDVTLYYEKAYRKMYP